MNGRQVAGILTAGVFVLLLAGTALAGAPTADGKSTATGRGTGVAITLTGTAPSGASEETDFSVDSGPANGGLNVTSGAMTCDGGTPASCSAQVTYTPSAGFEGQDSFAYSISNLDDGASSDATVTIDVGSAPVGVADPEGSCSSGVVSGAYEVTEDTPLTIAAGSCGLLDNDTDADGDSLTAAKVTNPSLGGVVVGSDGGFTYTPNANANGDDSFTYDASDGDLTSSPVTVSLHIDPVNDPPTFTSGGDVTVDENSGAYSAAWASSVSPGPNETGQTVSFQIQSDDNAGLFSVTPAVASNGTLTFTPAADTAGSATIKLVAVDNGGGNDTSGQVTFTITVAAVNQAPTFDDAGDVTVDEDSGTYTGTSWATNIDPGPNEGTQTVSFQVTSDDNPGLFGTAPAVNAAGTLTFGTAANRNGIAHLEIVAKDDGGTDNGGVDTSLPASITVTVNPVNDPPNAVNDTGIVVPENSPGQVINVLANDTSLPDGPEILTVTGVTQGVHGAVTITGSGTGVSYKPAPLYYGSDFFTYTITDPGGLTDTATVILTIAKDATAPVVTSPVPHIRTGVAMGSTTLLGQMTWSGSDAGVGLSRFDLQRSTNGGAYATVALGSATATSLNVTYTFGSSYRFRVRGVDRNGNASAWSYSVIFTPGRYQETSSYISYSTAWYLNYNTADSGSYARYSTVAGKWLVFTRSFRDVAFVAPMGATRGSVYIYVDGVKQATISLHASTSAYRRVLWQYRVSSIGTHAIKIVVAGNVRVDLDCFVVLR